MPGVPGAGGPPPKRSEQRRRRNEPAAGEPTQLDVDAEVIIPDADPDWHPVAAQWFESLKSSGQRHFYASSDWATAFVIAESISREMKPQPVTIGSGEDRVTEMVSVPPKGASLAAWLKGMTALLVTEGDRRRAAIELRKPKADGDEEAGSVSSLDAWRSRTDGTG